MHIIFISRYPSDYLGNMLIVLLPFCVFNPRFAYRITEYLLSSQMRIVAAGSLHGMLRP